MDRWLWAQCLCTFLFGALVGASELFTRYTDSARRLFRLASFWVYVAGNAVAAMMALLILVAFQVRPGFRSQAADAVTLAVIAGFGGMGVLRASVATVKINGHEVPAGPGAVVTALLGAIDRVVDRNQARRRSEGVRDYMKEISFAKARTSLVQHIIYMLSNPTNEASERLAASARSVSDMDMDDHSKAMTLGVLLIQYAGEEVLKQAVETLRASICLEEGVEERPENLTRTYVATARPSPAPAHGAPWSAHQ